MHSGSSSSPLIRYSVALLSTVLAFVLRWLLTPVLGPASPFILFYPAIALSGWFGGLGPGLTATGLSVVLVSCFLLLPHGFLVVSNPADVVALSIFILIGVFISILNESLHRARRGVEDSTKRLSETELRLQAILDNTTVSVYMKDLEGRYLIVNRAFEQAYGRSRDEILGRTDGDLSSPAFAAAFRAHDSRILALSEPITLEEEVKTHDGRAVTYLSSKFPLRDATGRAYAVCGISTDITDHKHSEKEIERLLTQEQAARAEAEAANRAKDEFLAVLSHELRTPLTAIMGWVGLLSMGRLDAETTTQGLEAIERSTKVQLRLIEDLLDVSRIITGNLVIEPGPLELGSMIQGVVNAVRPAAEAKRIELSARLEPGVGAVSGDPQRLPQVIWNLLANAIKFTPRGGRVEIRLMRRGSHACIVVSDTGEGISPDFLPHVFDRFRQADSSSTRPHGGLGLGLAIVCHLVRLHGGSVRADSAGEGQGSTFTVELPLLATPVGAQDEDPGILQPVLDRGSV